MKNMIRMRLVSLAEGVSWLVLLFIAMPLKYMAGFPIAVTYAGMAHGVLFMVLMAMVTVVWLSKRTSFSFAVKVMVAALFPFGAFVIDRHIKARIEEQAAAQRA
jgi:integral membrane protein